MFVIDENSPCEILICEQTYIMPLPSNRSRVVLFFISFLSTELKESRKLKLFCVKIIFENLEVLI